MHQEEQMEEIIRGTALFCNLSGESLEILASAGEAANVAQGEYLFRTHEPSDAMYIVADGLLDILITDTEGREKKVSQLKRYDVVGEIQILTGGLRTASVRASEDSKLLRFSREVLDSVAERNPGFINDLNSLILTRLQWNQLRDILPGLFGELGPEQLEDIVSLARWESLRHGEVLFRQDDPGDSFYILVTGLLQISIASGDGMRPVGQVRKGQVLGEMSLLTNEPRSATVTALRGSNLVRFESGDFGNMLKKYPDLLMQITRTIIARLRDMACSMDAKCSSKRFAVVPASPEPSISGFTRELVEELEAAGSVLYLDSDEMDRYLGTPGISGTAPGSPGAIRLSSWLSSQEDHFDYIVFQADPRATEWTRRCLQYSDQIIVAALAGEPPSLCEVEERFIYSGGVVGDVPMRLVLIHESGSAGPSGTARWLQGRNLVMHHHLLTGRRQDVQRLARHITGRAVGLVLGGGGARGLAHIGVIRALLESGIHIDAIGGTSMGALIGGELALGRRPDEMMMSTNMPFSTSEMLMDSTIPMLAFTTGKPYTNYIIGFYGEETMIEDLWLPYYCVTSNLSRAMMHVHSSGLMWKAIRASSSLPGILPPIVYGGEIHADGGIFNNVPADVMKDFAGGRVIAVDVGTSVDLINNTPYGKHISGIKLLLNKLNPLARRLRLPDMGTILMRSAEVVSIANQQKIISGSVDIHIKPEVDGFQILEWKAQAELMRIGYETVMHMVDDPDKARDWSGCGAPQSLQ
jgi:NTE family protein/lysophospholipid hydrolase